jgi:hypothetical protein
MNDTRFINFSFFAPPTGEGGSVPAPPHFVHTLVLASLDFTRAAAVESAAATEAMRTAVSGAFFDSLYT